VLIIKNIINVAFNYSTLDNMRITTLLLTVLLPYIFYFYIVTVVLPSETAEAFAFRSSNSSNDSIPNFSEHSSNISLLSKSFNANQTTVAWSGVGGRPVTPDIATSMGYSEDTKGFLITYVVPNSPASNAGLRGGENNNLSTINGTVVKLGGDIIIKADNNTVTQSSDVFQYIEEDKKEHENLSLTILRDGRTKTVNLTLVPQPEFMQYSTPEINIQFPRGWQTREGNTSSHDRINNIIGFYSPFESSTDRYAERLWVDIDNLPSPCTDLDHYLNETISSYKESFEDFKLVQANTNSTLSGNPAYTILYTYTVPNFSNIGPTSGTVYAMEIGTKIRDKVYYIEYFAEPAKFSHYLPKIQGMIGSFEVNLQDQHSDNNNKIIRNPISSVAPNTSANNDNDRQSTNITVGRTPVGVAINNRTNMVYVTSFEEDSVNVISAQTNKVIDNIIVGDGQAGISINTKTNRVYIANSFDNSVCVIDGRTNQAITAIEVGNNTADVAVNPNTNRIYATNFDDNSISVIDGNTNKVITNITVGASPTGIAVNPNTNMIYTTDWKNNTVSVIDGNSNTLVGAIPVMPRPSVVAVNPNTNMVYVANQDADRIAVINGTIEPILSDVIVTGNYSRVKDDPFFLQSPPLVDLPPASGIAVNPNTNMVYLSKQIIGILSSSSESIGIVSVIDASTNTVIKTTRVMSKASGIDTNPNTNMVYVANAASSTVTAINYNTNYVDSINAIGFKVLDNPGHIDINPFKNILYIGNELPSSVSVVDTKTDTIIKDIKINNVLRDLAYNLNTNSIYVITETTSYPLYRQNGDIVYVIDGDTYKIVTEINVGTEPFGVAVNPYRNIVYVTNNKDNTVSAIDGNTNKVITNITVGASPTGIAVNPNTNMIYVTNSRDDNVSVINAEFNIVFTNITVGSGPTGVAVNPQTNMVYVTNFFDKTVSVIDAERGQVIDNIALNNNPTSIAVNPKTNMIYVAHHFSNYAAIINGTTHEVNEIPVGQDSFDIAVNTATNRIYIPNSGSDSVSAIDGNTNKVLIGVSFITNPTTGGEIVCNEQKRSNNYTRYHIGSLLECRAKANSGFAFSSWSGSLASSPNNNDLTSLKISEYGTLNANFIEPVQLSIPPEFWTPLYGIIPGFLIPSIVRWFNGYRQRKHLRQFIKDIGKSDKDTLEKTITDSYTRGKISQSHYQLLKDKISEYYGNNQNR
jgi:YVTN family beta-propeller protein